LAGQAEFRPTTEPGQATALAEQATREGFATVVAAGGDGTVHEVANGILRAGSGAALGVLPLGSGNDYARMIGVPRSPYAAVQRLLTAETWAVDVGTVMTEKGRERFFLNTLGLGLSGAVTWESSRLKKHGLRGVPLYGLAAVRAIWNAFHPVPLTLTLDDQSEQTHLLYMAIALGRCEGGGFVVAPHAKLDDGLFDFLLAGRLSRLEAFTYVPRLALGLLPQDSKVIRLGRCREALLQAAMPFYSHTDGEQFTTPQDGSCTLQIRLHPGRLRIRGPAAT
jgi:YegS/Rv2252/BmrU family lipid kinase